MGAWSEEELQLKFSVYHTTGNNPIKVVKDSEKELLGWGSISLREFLKAKDGKLEIKLNDANDMAIEK